MSATFEDVGRMLLGDLEFSGDLGVNRYVGKISHGFTVFVLADLRRSFTATSRSCVVVASKTPPCHAARAGAGNGKTAT